MNPIVLRTPRLLLRCPVPADAEAIERFVSDRRIAEMTTLIPHPYPKGGALEWLAGVDQSWQDDCAVFAICLRDTGELIGVTSIIDDEEDVELGYWIGVPHWGKGYATEALHRVIRFGFNRLRLRRLHACHFAHNPASGRVMQKAGLLFEGMQPLGCSRGEERYDKICYGISAKEWRAHHRAFSHS